jgi:predicted DNA binding CopG/RHH family protein
VPAIGEKGESSMKAKTKKIKYTDEPLGNLRIVEDFLPSPEDLAFKEENVKITITLSKSSVNFFKKEAKKNHTQYQRMIRRLLDHYTAQHNTP